MKTKLRPAPEAGQDIVEYALILPLLLLLMFGIIEFGVLFLSYNTIANAAREGARAGIMPHATTTDIETITRARAYGANSNPANLGVQVVIGSNPNTVRVSVTYTTTWLTPVAALMGSSGNLVLRARATMNRE